MPTGVTLATLEELDRQLVVVPSGFHTNTKLVRQMGLRAGAFRSEGRVNWAQAEALALASLLTEGVPIRLTGQDTVRGTFSQRHLMLTDNESGEQYAPIQHLSDAKALIKLYNSPLTESAALAFEYGYGITERNALVLWEAQYGDFFNNAQVVVDQFVSTGQAKWNQESRLTLLLPHGYEGSGPSIRALGSSGFSSFRLRGICVSPTRPPQPSTSTSFACRRWPRSAGPWSSLPPRADSAWLRCGSGPSELAEGHFQEVLDDPTADHAQVRRLLLSTGKISWEVAARREQLGAKSVATARLSSSIPSPPRNWRGFSRAIPTWRR